MEINHKRSNFAQFSDDLWLVAEHDGAKIEFDVYQDDLIGYASSMVGLAIDCLRKSKADTCTVDDMLCNAIELIDSLNNQDAMTNETGKLLDQYRAETVALKEEVERLTMANARHTMNAIERICPDCGDDMCGDNHDECFKCEAERLRGALGWIADCAMCEVDVYTAADKIIEAAQAALRGVRTEPAKDGQ